jgi:hypothetical protein
MTEAEILEKIPVVAYFDRLAAVKYHLKLKGHANFFELQRNGEYLSHNTRREYEADEIEFLEALEFKEKPIARKKYIVFLVESIVGELGYMSFTYPYPFRD